MNKKKLSYMHEKPGYVVALDAGGVYAPGSLVMYGINPDDAKKDIPYANELLGRFLIRMFTNDAFTGEKVRGVILTPEATDLKIGDRYLPQYLWEEKNIVSFYTICNYVEDEKNGVCMMKPMEDLDAMLEHAKARGCFGTKALSIINKYDEQGIKDIMAQQVEAAKKVVAAGLVPILEPCINVHSSTKAECEELLHKLIVEANKEFGENDRIMYKLAVPEVQDLYADVIADPKVVRVIALSGGWSRDEVCERLVKNHGMVASFSRAFREGLKIYQSEEEFTNKLSEIVEQVYQASIS